MYKILIVEDELDIARLIDKFLIAAGFTTVNLHSGAQVVQTFLSERPDLIILDIMLPDKNGLDCCQEIRAQSEVPIILLTAKVEEQDRIAGLGIGADDYICKPFSAPELVMRVQAILKRVGKVASRKWKIDESKQQVFYKGNQIELTYYEFSLFLLLYKSPGRVYSREQILNFAFKGQRDTTDRAIDSHIKNIRKRFRDAGITESLIESVYAAGYRFKG